MRRRRAVAVLVGLAVLAAGLLLRPSCRPVDWFAQTDRAVGQARLPDATASRVWALSWVAAARATAGRTGPAAEDALAGAVATGLGELLPEQADTVQELLASDCRADEAAVAAGRQQARQLLAARTQDGLSPASLNPAFRAPPAGPGLWRPTPPDFAPGGSSGQGAALPLLLRTAEEVRARPPTPLGSATYVRDLAEVARLGAVDSVARTAAQTRVARFWEASTVPVFADVLRGAVAGLPAARRARVVAAVSAVTLDAQLAVYAAKYRLLRWRPVTALQVDGDGDDRTPRRPGWTPLLPTPPNPEHPSGHTAYAAAAVAVLRAELGARPAAPLQVRSPTGPARRYTEWQPLVQENVDGRVWGGVHLRDSDEAGAALGAQVAQTALPRLQALLRPVA